MRDLLYLDTARVGQISPSAHRALNDYFRLNAESHFPLYFEDFFGNGGNLPESEIAQYEGLECWQGIAELKTKIAEMFNATAVKRLAVCKIFSTHEVRCRPNVSALSQRINHRSFLASLSGYLLEESVPNPSCKITQVKVSEHRFEHGMSWHEICDQMCCQYQKYHCDGLFVPLVNNLGVHLPVQDLALRIRNHSQIRFVCVDIAQAINHVHLNASEDYFDFAIGGSHKWLRSHLPLGIGLTGNSNSRRFIEQSFIRWSQVGILDDPILNFTTSQRGARSEFGETINATPMIACAGAIADRNNELTPAFDGERYLADRTRLESTFNRLGLKLMETDHPFWSNIMIFESANDYEDQPKLLHHGLKKMGVATSLVDQQLRVSLPSNGLTDRHLDKLSSLASKGMKQ